MLSEKQKRTFDRDGYLVVPGVLDTAQIASLRAVLDPVFDAPAGFVGDLDKANDNPSVRMDVATRYPELRWLLVHPPLVAALRSLLGEDFLFLPEMSAHRSGYTGWHADTGSQERAGHRFHLDDDFLMVEAALYLQPNSKEWGGGLDVRPGSHKKPDLTLHPQTGFYKKVRRVLERLGILQTGYSIPTKPGDLLLFHFRILHKASWPKRKDVQPPEKKLAIFFACSRNDRHAQAYRAFIGSREDYHYLKDLQYPAELVAMTKSAGVSLMP